jgi:transposase
MREDAANWLFSPPSFCPEEKGMLALNFRTPDGSTEVDQRRSFLRTIPFSGHVFVFRGRRGDLIKLLWWDGDGLCLFANREF